MYIIYTLIHIMYMYICIYVLICINMNMYYYLLHIIYYTHTGDATEERGHCGEDVCAHRHYGPLRTVHDDRFDKKTTS